MFWRRVGALPRPVLVAVIAIPVMLLVGGTLALLLNRSSPPAHRRRHPIGGGQSDGLPQHRPVGHALSGRLGIAVGLPVAVAEPQPPPSPSPSASTAAPGPAAPVANCAASPGTFPGSIATSFPTAMAFAPDGRLFWAERAGTVKVWQGGAAHDFASVSTSTSGERGLLGLAVAPSFAQDHYVYAFYSRADNLGLQRVVRWTDCAGAASNYTVIIDNLPAGSDCCHKGGRIAFSPDGYLFVTIGENHVPSAAQDPCDLRGKVLRYTSGGAPAGQCGAVYTRGLRNPFGIAFAPDGTMAVTNNGPSGDAGTPCGSCGDMVDIVGKSAGVDYQWPGCWGYSHSIGGAACPAGSRPPDYSTEGGPYPKNSPYFVAPTGMTFANGHFLFCADISNGHVFQYNGPGSVSDMGIGGCLLDVKQGPDFAIFTAGGSSITRH